MCLLRLQPISQGLQMFPYPYWPYVHISGCCIPWINIPIFFILLSSSNSIAASFHCFTIILINSFSLGPFSTYGIQDCLSPSLPTFCLWFYFQFHRVSEHISFPNLLVSQSLDSSHSDPSYGHPCIESHCATESFHWWQNQISHFPCSSGYLQYRYCRTYMLYKCCQNTRMETGYADRV